MKTKEDIINALEDNFNDLLNWLRQQDADRFEISPIAGKWTTGEHVEHLVKSSEAVNMAMRLPKLQIRMMFGKPNREGRTYEQLVARYQEKLAAGGAASGRYVPKNITNDQQANLLETLLRQKEKLQAIASKWKEEDLDNYLLPHPLLGKLTVREMLFFTAYHTTHHTRTLKEKY